VIDTVRTRPWSARGWYLISWIPIFLLACTGYHSQSEEAVNPAWQLRAPCTQITPSVKLLWPRVTAKEVNFTIQVPGGSEEKLRILDAPDSGGVWNSHGIDVSYSTSSTPYNDSRFREEDEQETHCRDHQAGILGSPSSMSRPVEILHTLNRHTYLPSIRVVGVWRISQGYLSVVARSSSLTQRDTLEAIIKSVQTQILKKNK